MSLDEMWRRVLTGEWAVLGVATALLAVVVLAWPCARWLIDEATAAVKRWQVRRRVRQRRREFEAEEAAKEARRLRVAGQVQRLLIEEIVERGILPAGVQLSSSTSSGDEPFSNAGYVRDAQLHRECEQHFLPVKSQTHCTFAREAKLVYPFDWDGRLSFDENVLRNVPLLLEATVTGPEQLVDGVVFYAPGEWGATVEQLGDTMARILWLLNAYDPTAADLMSAEGIDRRGWRWAFNGANVFITSFGPCYAQSNPRYAFGSSEFCFVLFQPESSFGRHQIGDYASPTRMRIRTNFAKHGRPFWCPASPRYYPFIWNFVGPEHPIDPLVLKRGPPDQWWRRKPALSIAPRYSLPPEVPRKKPTHSQSSIQTATQSNSQLSASK